MHGFRRIFLDLDPESGDGRVHRPAHDIGRIAPHLGEQLAAGHVLAGPIGEVGEERRLPARERRADLTAAAHLAAREVHRAGLQLEQALLHGISCTSSAGGSPDVNLVTP